MQSAALQHQIPERFVAARVARRGDGMAIEVEHVLVDLRPGPVMHIDAVPGGVIVERGTRMLVVVDIVAEDPHLVRTADPLARKIVRRFLSGPLCRLIFCVPFIEHLDGLTAPPGDFHVRDLDIEAADDVDADVVVRLLAEAGSVDPEAGDAHMVVRLKSRRTIDRQEDFFCVAAMRPEFEERPQRLWCSGRGRRWQRRRCERGRWGGYRGKGTRTCKRHARTETQRNLLIRRIGEVQDHVRPKQNGRVGDRDRLDQEPAHGIVVLLVDLRIRLPDLHEVRRRILQADPRGGRRALKLEVVNGEVDAVLEPQLRSCDARRGVRVRDLEPGGEHVGRDELGPVLRHHVVGGIKGGERPIEGNIGGRGDQLHARLGAGKGHNQRDRGEDFVCGAGGAQDTGARMSRRIRPQKVIQEQDAARAILRGNPGPGRNVLEIEHGRRRQGGAGGEHRKQRHPPYDCDHLSTPVASTGCCGPGSGALDVESKVCPSLSFPLTFDMRSMSGEDAQFPLFIASLRHGRADGRFSVLLPTKNLALLTARYRPPNPLHRQGQLPLPYLPSKICDKTRMLRSLLGSGRDICHFRS